MDVSHEIQKQEAVIGAFGGTVSGAASGALAGSKAGPYGALAGAVVGGVASGIGGALDVANVDKAQKEAKSFATDMYNMNLRNIQAIPYSLAKTSSFVYNNKIWPMLEYYSCTEEEKRAFRLKLEYNGMTVNKITTLADVTEEGTIKYVKGQMIRLEDLSDDSHMAYTIYDEINKGVYL